MTQTQNTTPLLDKRRSALLLDARDLPAWGTTDNLPTEFALFYYGANRTTKGIVYLTEVSARKCLATFKEYGNELAGDYEHAAAKEGSGDPVPASCWFSIALRHDGLYAVNVKWTERGAALLRAREYRYYSPFFWMEEGNDHKWYVTEIINVALTNQPATKNQRPLVASNKPRRIKRKHKMFDQKQIDSLKELLVGAGVKEEAAGDLILRMMPIVCGESPMKEAPPAEIPMADPPKPEEEKPMEYKEGDINSELKAQLKSAMDRLSVLEKNQKEQDKKERDEVFSAYKKEGRLRFTTETKARGILEKHGIEVFKETYAAIPSLVKETAPPAPATLTKTNPDIKEPTLKEISDYQAAHKIDSPAKAAQALRRERIAAQK